MKALRMYANRRPRLRQAGFTLLEVLVAILICSFGLLGIIGLQSRAIQFAASSEDTNRAMMLANELAATMYSSRTVNLPTGTISAWQSRVSSTTGAGLPNGAGSVAVSGGTVATITITWRANNVAATAANATNRYVTNVVVAGP